MSPARDDGRPDPKRSLERDAMRLARREPSARSFWQSLSVLGTLGWSIALPAAFGAWLGHRLDLRYDTGVHFTLILLSLGVAVGGAVAWRVLHAHRE